MKRLYVRPKRKSKRNTKSKQKYNTIYFSKGKYASQSIRFKRGGLRRQLGLTKSQTFTKKDLRQLQNIPIGIKFTFNNKERKMTLLLKRRVNLALTLMSFNKRS